MAKYCGYTLPAAVESTGTSMYIQFVSDKYINKSGMKGQLSVISGKFGVSFSYTLSRTVTNTYLKANVVCKIKPSPANAYPT